MSTGTPDYFGLPSYKKDGINGFSAINVSIGLTETKLVNSRYGMGILKGGQLQLTVSPSDNYSFVASLKTDGSILYTVGIFNHILLKYEQSKSAPMYMSYCNYRDGIIIYTINKGYNFDESVELYVQTFGTTTIQAISHLFYTRLL